MNLTKILYLLPAILLFGCANQESIIPSDGPEMKDIYRGALGETGENAGVHVSEAEQICKKLNLDESIEKCITKTTKALDGNRLSLDENPNNESLSYIEYTRTAENEIESLFPRILNPDLVIYIYPHLATKNQAPIPGYSSVLPLFERVQYRLPGESLYDHKGMKKK